MTETTRRIRESAPFRKSMSMSSDDVSRADELERLFTTLYPDECPFSFSKTMCKALEIALTSINNTPSASSPSTSCSNRKRPVKIGNIKR